MFIEERYSIILHIFDNYELEIFFLNYTFNIVNTFIIFFCHYSFTIE